MRHWILVFLMALCAAPLMAQDSPPEPAASTVFFLARDDTNQDGHVTDIDNMRLYEVALDGTVLFVTPPEQHVLMFTTEVKNIDDVHVAWLVQDIDQSLWLNTLSTGKFGAEAILWTSLRHYAVITALDAGEEGIRWTGRLHTGETRTEVQKNLYDLESRAAVTPEPDQPAPTLDIPGRTLLVQQVVGEIGTLVQDLAAERPVDALWLYEVETQTLIPLKTWLFIEPLLFAVHEAKIAILGRELEGWTSLYILDFSIGVTSLGVARPLSGLIDPAYTSMQWTSDGMSLLLVGESGDFVVSNIGRIEALYGLDLITGAFTRLSPEGTLVDRASVTSR